MKIHELLDRDPRVSALANGGQARIAGSNDQRTTAELRAELETFVCDGQYGDALKRILDSYLGQLDRPRQNAVWVSGFFGSGKSHLLKMLAHLWVNTEFEDGVTARGLVRDLPDEVVAALIELDQRSKRIGLNPISASGAMPSGHHERVRLTVLGFLLKACGFPEKYPAAQFCFWLRENGYLEKVRRHVESAGKSWTKSVPGLHGDSLIAQGVLLADPHFAKDEKDARRVLQTLFPMPPGDISTTEFLEAARSALSTKPELPHTVLVLDEVQQFIGDSSDRATLITELSEAIQTQLDSRVLLVASGQSALSATPLLQKLKDRFRIPVQLSDTDVEAVTRKVILQKKASASAPIRDILARNAGEVSRQLQGTRIGERPEDRQFALLDYPLLPTRRRFWEECFRAVDAAGTHSQLRSQLRILHDAVRSIADRDLGTVIPGDALFEAIAPDLVNTGVLLGELNTRIQEQSTRPEEGPLRKRICGVVFLISKLSREPGFDSGVRATPRTIADVLVEDLEADSGPLRRRVETQLEAMANDGTLMRVGDEYRLLTTQGAEWDRAFKEHLAALGSRIPEMQAKQDQLLAAAVQQTLADLRPKQGESKVPRSLELHARPDAPPEGADSLLVWLRDGSSSSQKDVEAEARRRGQQDAVIHVFLAKPGSDLQARLREAEAARHVLEAKGQPSEPAEAREACESMRSRLQAAETARDELIRELVAASKVYQGGGNEVYGESLRQKLETALAASLARLFPRFHEADHRSWSVALQRARQGSDEPFACVGWERPMQEHPVVQELLRAIGAGARGLDLRKALRAPPFGWPQDAIDAALIALHRTGALQVQINGQALPAGQLDQNKISSAEFRLEKVRLTVPEKLQLRGLFQKAGVLVKSGEEEHKAPLFLEALRSLALSAGGEAPLPACPTTRQIDELKRLSGSEQLAALLSAQSELEALIAAWTKAKERAELRRPAWERLKRLAQHASGLPILQEVQPELDALIQQRSLLENSDYATPLIQRLERALRESLRAAHAASQAALDAGERELEASPEWTRLPEAKRLELRAAQRLTPLPDLDLADTERLLQALDQRPLARWAELSEGLPTRFARARADAARALEPKVQQVSLKSPLLKTSAELEAFLESTKADLLRRLNDGPIVIG
jgi:hypothetical protein